MVKSSIYNSSVYKRPFCLAGGVFGGFFRLGVAGCLYILFVFGVIVGMEKHIQQIKSGFKTMDFSHAPYLDAWAHRPCVTLPLGKSNL